MEVWLLKIVDLETGTVNTGVFSTLEAASAAESSYDRSDYDYRIIGPFKLDGALLEN